MQLDPSPSSARRRPRSARRGSKLSTYIRAFEWRSRAGVAVLVLAGGLSPGCAASAGLDQQIAQTAQALGEVEAQGALRCAPRELAVARSHLEFARLEREQGFPTRARRHVEVADENVRAARVLSPASRCASAAGPADPASGAAGAPP